MRGPGEECEPGAPVLTATAPAAAPAAPSVAGGDGDRANARRTTSPTLPAAERVETESPQASETVPAGVQLFRSGRRHRLLPMDRAIVASFPGYARVVGASLGGGVSTVYRCRREVLR
jgi:hypothetical protein